MLTTLLLTAQTLAAPPQMGQPDAVVPDLWLFRSSAEDTDGDGLPDGEDSCPSDPEDADGYEDADGCPELTHVRLVFTDPEGLIETVQAEIIGWGAIEGAGVHDVQLPPGTYEVRAYARGYRPLLTSIRVSDGPAREVVRALAPWEPRQVQSPDAPEQM